jgi:hypothetical protein
MNRALGFAATALLLSVAVIACGGGGGGGTSAGTTGSTVVPPGNSAPNSTATGGNAALSILIPSTAAASSSAVRRPAYVSAATKSVAVFAYPAAATPPPTATTLVNVGAGLAGCTSVTGGTSCTITVPAQYGSMTFTVKTYDNVLGTGNLLSQATFTQTIGPNQAPIPITLSGVVAGVSLSIPQYAYPAGGGSFTLTVNALDVNGAIIAGGGSYNVPITITSPDTADITISPNPVTGPGQTVTVTYDASAPSGITLRSHTPGLSANAEGAVAFSIAQPVSTSYEAYVLDQNTNTVFGFPAGAVGNPGVQAHDTFPSLNYPNLLSVSPAGDIAVGTGQSYSPGTIELVHGGVVKALSLGYGPASFAFDPSSTSATAGDLAVLEISPNPSINYYPPNAGPTSTPIPGTSIASTGLEFSVGTPALAIDGTGNVYVLQYGGGWIVLEYPAGSSVSTRTISITTPYGGVPFGIAVAADGTLAALVAGHLAPSYSSPYVSEVQIFAPNATTPTRTLTGGQIAASYGTNMAFASDDSLYFAYGNTVSVYAPTATGTAPPERAFSTFLAGAHGLNGVGLGPAAGSTPAATSVAGDMLNLAANRTWNYAGTSAGGPNTTLSLYVDPAPVDGNTGLVAFVSPTTAPDALPSDGGTLAGAVGVANQSDGYHALSYGSVSNDSFGLVPGAPLLVPTSLTLGQTFVPYPGITATVTGISTTTSAVQAACPGVTLQANVSYVLGGSGVGVLSYAPGCGITKFTNQIGASYTLQSITSNPQVGQQSFVRHVLNASYGSMLRALWQHALNGNGKI